jgi:spermidine synthase
MTDSDRTQTLGLPAPRRLLPVLLALFAGSGCSALIYEIVWFQLLQLVIGSSAVSLGVLLGTYMGGMCLGSLLLPRIISVRRHPLRVYALLELGIGIIGVAVLFVMPEVDRFYAAHAGAGLPGILMRGAVCGLCLLPPTILMGATLPAISRWVETTPTGVSWLGLLYGGNITGAVLGCLLAGFYLLRVYDMATATYVAAAINATVSVLGLVLASLAPGRGPEAGAPSVRVVPARAPGARLVYVAIALSGLCALGAEVIWTRLLSLMLVATVYTFSIILAVFLVGLGIGSGAGAFLSRWTGRPRELLGVCQVLLAAAAAWAAYQLGRSLPYWPINPELSSSPWFDFQLDLLRCAWVILPAACLWGASFPLALAAAASRGGDPGRLVGGIYAANTVGAIVGALAFSMVLIPAFGTQQSQRVLVGLCALSGVMVLAQIIFSRGRGGSGGTASSFAPGSSGQSVPSAGSSLALGEGERTAQLPSALAGEAPAPGSRAGAVVKAAVLALAAWGAALLVWGVPPVPGELIAHGRFLPSWRGRSKIIYMGEGMSSSVAVSELSGGVRNFHVSGKVEASSEPADMRLQRMLGLLPALVHPRPRSVLVVGCGAGVTAGSFVTDPDVERIVLCELEPLIPPLADKYFGAENYGVVKDPRVQIVFDDARHYILTTREKFDIITSDPIHPWVKGSATLYSTEYFELCKRHLNPGGVITQWVPLYESDEGTVQSEIATFFQVFPGGTVWGNDIAGKGYDVVLLGGDAARIDVDGIERRLMESRFQFMAKSLEEVGFPLAVDLLGTYAGRASDLKPWLQHAQINSDRNLRLQYMAGMGLNCHQGEAIYNNMLKYRQFPQTLFVASEATQRLLRRAMSQPAAP